MYPTRLWNIDKGCVTKVHIKQEYVIVTHVWEYYEKNLKEETIDSAGFIKDVITSSKYCNIKNIFIKHRVSNIWIDTLCIRQHDANDKALEIPKMGEYYRNACFTALVPPLEDYDSIYDAALYLEQIWDERDINEDSIRDEENVVHMMGIWVHDEKLRSAVVAFVYNKWFERVWTFQEFALSTCFTYNRTLQSKLFILGLDRKVDILKGIAVVSICNIMWSEAIHDNPANLFLNKDTINKQWCKYDGKISNYWDMIDRRTYCIRIGFDSLFSDCNTIPSAYRGMLDRTSTYAEDRIYGLLGLLDYNVNLEIVYSSDFSQKSRKSKENYKKLFNRLVDCAINIGDDFFLYSNTDYGSIESSAYKPVMTHKLTPIPVDGVLGLTRMIKVNKDDLQLEVDSKYVVVSFKEMDKKLDYNFPTLSARRLVNTKHHHVLTDSFCWAKERGKNIDTSLCQWLWGQASFWRPVYMAVIEDEECGDITVAFLFINVSYANRFYFFGLKKMYVMTTNKYKSYKLGSQEGYYGVVVVKTGNKYRRVGYSVSNRLVKRNVEKIVICC